MSFTIGIDPGVQGAIAIISESGEVIAVRDMPIGTKTTTSGKTRRRVDPMVLHSIIAEYAPIDLIIIEDVHSRPGEGAVQAFSFGHGCGVVETVARLSCPPVAYVRSQEWKSYYGITADKTEARTLAESLTGDRQTYRRVKDADRAEAVLIGLYGRLRGHGTSHLRPALVVAA